MSLHVRNVLSAVPLLSKEMEARQLFVKVDFIWNK